MLCTFLVFGVGILLRSDSAVECRGVGSGQFSSFNLIPFTSNFFLLYSRRKKARLFRIGLSCIWSLVMSYFHIANATLSSALFRFTTEFGMGSGGSKTLLSPSKFGVSPYRYALTKIWNF